MNLRCGLLGSQRILLPCVSHLETAAFASCSSRLDIASGVTFVGARHMVERRPEGKEDEQRTNKKRALPPQLFSFTAMGISLLKPLDFDMELSD